MTAGRGEDHAFADGIALPPFVRRGTPRVEGGERDGLLARLRISEEARERAERERNALQIRVYRAKFDERLRFARDLHDRVGQDVAVLGLGLRRLLSRSTGPAVEAEVARLCRQVDELGERVRTFTTSLRASALDRFGLAQAIRLHLEEWRELTGTAADVLAYGVPDDLPAEIEDTIFVALQEALTNVTKHAAGVTHVEVTLIFAENVLTLAVEDDGAGSPAGAASRQRGNRFGLAGMRERFKLAGGTLHTEAGSKRGFTMIGHIPMPVGAR